MTTETTETIRTATTTVDHGLDAGPTGRIVRPDDRYWDVARAAWVVNVDQRPAAVVEVRSAEDVAAAVTSAAENGLRVTAQGTGHGVAAVRPLADTVLIRTRGIDHVLVDPDTSTARVGAGAEWAAVTAAAHEHGLVAQAGSSPDVGVAGFLLSGGVSWLARERGLAVNDILSLEVVTADGRIRRISEDRDPDLFWAVRGGGGSFCVVTEIELRLHEVPALVAGTLFFPITRAGEVLHTWRRWLADVSTRTVSCGRLMQFPGLPELPPPLRGQAFALVEVAHQGTVSEVDELVAPLRALGPAMDTIAACTPVELAALHMDPPGPTPSTGNGMVLDSVPAEAVDALVAVAGPGSGSPLLSVEVRHLGAAAGVAPAHAGAVGRLEGEFLCFAVGITPDRASEEKVAAHIDAVQTALAPWTGRYGYANFVERSGSRDRFHPPATMSRLRAVKQEYDPHRVIVGSHDVVLP